jgi:hypothetical protein
VFPFKSWEVQKVDVVIEGKAFTLAKDEKGKWNLTSPVTARASAGKVSSFISSLSQLEAVDFLSPPSSPEELAPYGLKEPKAAITLYEKEERKIGTLRLGKGKGEKEACYATDEAGDTIYRIKPEFMSKDLPAGIDDIREKRLMDVYRYQVAQIEALDAGKGVVLEKKGSIWKLKRPESRDLEEKEVSELLSLASDIEADSFVSQESKDLAAYGLSQPALTVTLKNDKGEDVGTLLISSKGPEGESTTCYAKEAKDTWIGVIKVDTRNKIQEKIASLGKNKG